MKRTEPDTKGQTASHAQERGARAESTGAETPPPTAALHRSMGNQAVQSFARENGVRESANAADSKVGSGPDRSTTRKESSVQRSVASDSDGERATDDGEPTVRSELCPRCVRRFRAGKPLNCQDCEEALGRTPVESTVRRAVGDGVLQPKLEVGSPDDEYEREAERVARDVLRMTEPSSGRTTDAGPAGGKSSGGRRETGGDIAGNERADSEARPDRRSDGRRRGPGAGTSTGCSACGAVRRTSVSVRRDRSPTPRTSGSVDGAMERRIQSVRTGGRQLPESVRSFFEPRFGTDLSDVRVHTGPTASETADAIQAKAYTVGRDIVFNHGEYRPESTSGRRLLAHELTHVLQQRGGTEAVSRQLGVEDYPDCTPEITGIENPEERLEEARQLGVNMVESAISSLERVQSGERVGQRDQNALATHFHNPSAGEIRTALGHFRGTKAALERKHRIICNTAGSGVCRHGNHGYAWPNGGPYIHVCPSVLAFGEPLAHVLVHEAAHVAGAEKDCYEWEDCYSNLSSADAVENADSYAHFADAVHIRIIRVNP